MTTCRYGCGTVYRLTPGGSLTTLYSFHQTDGANPHARLLLASDGNFYGTTFHGGSMQGLCANYSAPGCGTAFRITPSGVLTTLHVFCLQSDCADGGTPTGGLIQGSDGYLYGMTGPLAPGNAATIYRMSLQGELTTLYKFPKGWSTLDRLLQAPDGNFYGMVCCGGTPGSIFSMTRAGIVTTLHTFCQQYPCPGGQAPEGSLALGSDGLFYGTTDEGGSINGYGTVFSFDVGFKPLSVSKTGSGTVIGGDGHIYCGSTCSYVYANGRQLELTAIPAPGYTFSAWTGCDNMQGSYCFVTLTSARNVYCRILQFFGDTDLAGVETVDGKGWRAFGGNAHAERPRARRRPGRKHRQQRAKRRASAGMDCCSRRKDYGKLCSADLPREVEHNREHLSFHWRLAGQRHADRHEWIRLTTVERPTPRGGSVGLRPGEIAPIRIGFSQGGTRPKSWFPYVDFGTPEKPVPSEVEQCRDSHLRMRQSEERTAKSVRRRANGGFPYFASYTVFPPTTVRSTFVCNISGGATFVRSRSSTTKSASIPGASVPLLFSMNSA